MKIAFVIVAVIYVLGFGFTFWIHTQLPVTFGLALLRSFVWPAWILFGWPHGSPMPMD